MNKGEIFKLIFILKTRFLNEYLFYLDSHIINNITL